MREKINNIISKKWFVVLFSIVTSTILWMYVTYVENPQQTWTVTGIKIEYEGEEELLDSGLIVTDTDREKVNIRFSGRRNAVAQLTNSNTTVTVDLTDVLDAGTRPGVYQLSYKVNYPSGLGSIFVSAEDTSTDYITVTVEELASAEIPVKAVVNGKVAEGFQAEPKVVSPESIKVSGPKEIISGIESALVVVDIENLNKTYEDELSFALVDKAGQVVDRTLITTDTETVAVKIPVIMVKTVDVNVKFVYTNFITEKNFNERVKISIDPENITLSGDAATLEGLESVVAGTIDLSSFSYTTKETFDIVIPNDVTNVTGTTKATVTVEVLDGSIKDYTAANVSVTNVTEGYTAKIDTQSIDARLRGSLADLNAVRESNIRVVADLSDLGDTTGTYSVPAKVYVDGYKEVDVIGENYVTVTISKK